MRVPAAVLSRTHAALVVAEKDALDRIDDDQDGRKKWIRAMWARTDFEVYVTRELPQKVLVVDIDVGRPA